MSDAKPLTPGEEREIRLLAADHALDGRDALRLLATLDADRAKLAAALAIVERVAALELAETGAVYLKQDACDDSPYIHAPDDWQMAEHLVPTVGQCRDLARIAADARRVLGGEGAARTEAPTEDPR